MQSFKAFITKEFKQIYRDRRTLLVLFGMPIIQMLLFGFAIRNEVQNARVMVLDSSRDEVTRQLVNKIDASNYFSVAGEIQDINNIEAIFQQGEIDEVIVFENDFARKLERGGQPAVYVITDASNPNLAQLIQQYSSSIIVDFQHRIFPAVTEGGGITTHANMLFNPQLESVNLFVPGLIAVILMLISTLMTSIAITREKEMGNMEILLVSPLHPSQVIIGKVLPYLVLSFINVLTVLIMAQWVFDVPFRGSYSLFLAESLLFIFAALALGVLISTKADDQQTAMMVSLAGLLLPTVLLSGFIFPIASMPQVLQWISNLIPARWFLVIVRSIMLKDSNLLFLWKETLVLLVMTIGFIVLSVRSFKMRLE
ncbi:ABC-2 type transport system permease protein [Fodinibius roseus]|uniref:ABC-2 type transport system permease protein n=1 Tax=Fodinibius roseus TaxID=1194090 RepID=A0A1M4WFS4_9BACT|nr:ABC transporter permease [Fodinibius roseus]SHE80098.1 ABC-2 type transport system permease protein [Fodinibius roseus]